MNIKLLATQIIDKGKSGRELLMLGNIFCDTRYYLFCVYRVPDMVLGVKNTAVTTVLISLVFIDGNYDSYDNSLYFIDMKNEAGVGSNLPKSHCLEVAELGSGFTPCHLAPFSTISPSVLHSSRKH